MDGGAQKLLESVTTRTLHAQNFSRSSTRASLVLTDLLSRYLTLLTSTCAKYAEHAGRTRLTAQDAVVALEELGVSIQELHEFGTTEGIELNRYAHYKSLRRVEDLKEFRARLSDGLRADSDDAIPLHWAAVPPELEGQLEEEDDEESAEDASADDDSPMDFDAPESFFSAFRRDPLALSGTDFASPSRKRQRTLDWNPPEHVPSFLPPFPSTSDSPLSPHSPRIPPTVPPPLPVEGTQSDKPPTPPELSISQSQPPTITSTSAAASDYLVQLPYSQSSISSVSEWHLPSAPPASTSLVRAEQRWATPATDPSLLAAYHHILTHPAPPNSTHAANPPRHKVAMALLALTQSSSRWDIPDTLYATLASNHPRVSSNGPTYPVVVGDSNPADGTTKKGDKDTKLPPAVPRSVAAPERIAQLVSQQSSRIPELARHVLPPTILSRTSRLTHPPALSRNNKILTYGTGIPAPWNANAIPTADNVAPNVKETQPNGKDGPPPALPDARLFATWDHEHKDFRLPLAPIKQRSRLGSVQMGGSTSGSGPGNEMERRPSAGTISLGGRSRASSRVG